MDDKLFKELNSLKNVCVYHGSDVLVDKPRIMQPIRALDFGAGFYTTTNIEQAKSFARRVRDRNGSSETYISFFSLKMDLLKNMNCLYFKKPDKKWLDFVSANRNGNYIGENYDIIYGPVANDTVFRTFIAYQNRILSEKETIKRLKIRKLYNQMVFTNEKSLECIEFLDNIT